MPMEKIVHSNDFSVNESLLTGEPYAVFKSEKTVKSILGGTLVASGLAVYRVTNWPKYRGWEIRFITKHQRNTYSITNSNSKLKKVMAIMGIAVFLLVWVFIFGKRIT
jgi:Ca2+-transporting ATPase